ncbi:hypothetical protein [Rummeliibacillus suwonensis]|uniref:hypothetical protein n=1 Tax=Rummeliibacillus suwonensis TaxID=1306154 RepID=UPI0028979EE0|nr:hypothetical protein [Rummeliibacillus suwonensis]
MNVKVLFLRIIAIIVFVVGIYMVQVKNGASYYYLLSLAAFAAFFYIDDYAKRSKVNNSKND